MLAVVHYKATEPKGAGSGRLARAYVPTSSHFGSVKAPHCDIEEAGLVLLHPLFVAIEARLSAASHLSKGRIHKCRTL